MTQNRILSLTIQWVAIALIGVGLAYPIIDKASATFNSPVAKIVSAMEGARR